SLRARVLLGASSPLPPVQDRESGREALRMGRRTRRTLAAALGLLLAAATATVHAAVLANSISVSGDSISRGFNANTSSCNYGDNVSRSWATGDDHGSSFCSAGPTGTYSHAERLECAAGGNITNFNDARSCAP